MPVYDADSLRTAVRNMFQNVGEDIVVDDVLDTFLEAGIRRMSHDKPNEVIVELDDVTVSGWFDISTKTDLWEDKFSVIRGFANMPDMSTAREVEWLVEGHDWNFMQLAVPMVWVANSPGSLGALAKITTPWRVINLSNSWYGSTAVTTVPYQWLNALELSCAIELARGMAANAAGKLTTAFNADVIDWRNKQREYSNQAREWERRYWLLLGYNVSGGPPPVMISMEYDRQRHLDGSYPLTHQ